MKAINIDFASRTVGRVVARSDRKSRWLGALAFALCLAGLVAANLVVNRQQIYRDRLAEIDSAATLETSKLRRPAMEISSVQAKAVNLVVQQLNVPWSRLFDTLERVTPTSIALLELTPDLKKNVIKGIAEAESMEAALNYVARLNQQPSLNGVVLSKHEVNAEDANKPVKFEFEANWKESAP